jgi:ApbE superfamily uncharacterized protein (UPF0280 family)
MFIEIGPATLVIAGTKENEVCQFDRVAVEGLVRQLLAEIRDSMPVLRQKAFRIKKTGGLPEVGRRMVDAVRCVDEGSLTPMAAVAGALSDMVKEFLLGGNPDLLSVNNGGDVSVFNREETEMRIGIGDISSGRPTPYVLLIQGMASYGVATSGFGGRSFTTGLADVATVVAESGAIADAAATFICNETFVEAPEVVRQRAGELDPLTDIPDELVTVCVGNLNAWHVKRALHNGLNAAKRLRSRGTITDALIALKGKAVVTIGGGENIRLEVRNGG